MAARTAVRFRLTGTEAYERVNTPTNLAVGSGASLTAPVVFGAGDSRFTIAGAFAGSVDGGAGTDMILVSGGSVAAPVTFSTVANVEAFGMPRGLCAGDGDGGRLDANAQDRHHLFAHYA